MTIASVRPGLTVLDEDTVITNLPEDVCDELREYGCCDVTIVHPQVVVLTFVLTFHDVEVQLTDYGVDVRGDGVWDQFPKFRDFVFSKEGG